MTLPSPSLLLPLLRPLVFLLLRLQQVSRFRSSYHSSSHGHFVGSHRHSSFGYILRHPTQFINYSAWLNYGYPVFWRSFARPHTRFRGSHGDGFVGKDAYPQLTASTGMACYCPPPRFYLSSRNPSRFESLKSKFSEGDGVATTRDSPQSSSMLLTIFSSSGVTVDIDRIYQSLIQNRTWKSPPSQLLINLLPICIFRKLTNYFSVISSFFSSDFHFIYK